MPFEIGTEYDFDNLATETKYRFAEIELSYAITTVRNIFRNDPDVHKKAPRFLYELLIPFSERSAEKESAFEEMIRSNYFRNPGKHEIINYFLYHQQSYATTRKVTGVSPNTIAKHKYQQSPIYHPMFKYWTPDYLYRWDTVKENFNLFNLKQIQTTI